MPEGTTGLLLLPEMWLPHVKSEFWARVCPPTTHDDDRHNVPVHVHTTIVSSQVHAQCCCRPFIHPKFLFENFQLPHATFRAWSEIAKQRRLAMSLLQVLRKCKTTQKLSSTVSTLSTPVNRWACASWRLQLVWFGDWGRDKSCEPAEGLPRECANGPIIVPRGQRSKLAGDKGSGPKCRRRTPIPRNPQTGNRKDRRTRTPCQPESRRRRGFARAWAVWVWVWVWMREPVSASVSCAPRAAEEPKKTAALPGVWDTPHRRTGPGAPMSTTSHDERSAWHACAGLGGGLRVSLAKGFSDGSGTETPRHLGGVGQRVRWLSRCPGSGSLGACGSVGRSGTRGIALWQSR